VRAIKREIEAVRSLLATMAELRRSASTGQLPDIASGGSLGADLLQCMPPSTDCDAEQD
jgi:hypothetical protein